MIAPMPAKSAASSGVATLKCDGTPRADCSVMSVISTTMVNATPQLMHLYGAFSS